MKNSKLNNNIKKEQTKHKVLILGSGMMAGPVVEYLSQKNDVTICDKSEKNIQEMIKSVRKKLSEQIRITTYKGDLEKGMKKITFEKTKNTQTEKEEKERITINKLIQENEVVISLLPATIHTKVAKICIEEKKHLVTASYSSLEMNKLGELAEKNNVMLINECGLDPGIDHMSSMKIIDKIKEQGGKITSFESYCGGLPSNKDNNPLGYQFSWSPLGVLRAAKSSAKFLKNKEIKTIPSGQLFCEPFTLKVEDNLFEAYYNRNSLQYIELYGMSNVQTFIRGTLRYKGWAEIMQIIFEMNLLEEMKQSLGGVTYRKLVASLIGKQEFSSEQEAIDSVAEYLKINNMHPALKKLSWLGLFSNEVIPEGIRTPLNALNRLMQKKLSYEKGQTDMIVMKHIIKAEIEEKEKTHHSSIIFHGEKNGFSAMAQTVGLPVAIIAELVLEKKIERRGLIIPITPDIYIPTMVKLAEKGIIFKEKILE